MKSRPIWLKRNLFAHILQHFSCRLARKMSIRAHSDRQMGIILFKSSTKPPMHFSFSLRIIFVVLAQGRHSTLNDVPVLLSGAYHHDACNPFPQNKPVKHITWNWKKNHLLVYNVSFQLTFCLCWYAKESVIMRQTVRVKFIVHTVYVYDFTIAKRNSKRKR